MWLFKNFFKKNFFSDYNFKNRFLKKDFFHKNFLTKKYLKNGLLFTNLNPDFFLAISNLFFLQRYISKISLPKISSLKLKYWNMVSGLLVNKFVNKNKLWNSKNFNTTKTTVLDTLYNNNVVELLTSNKLILLSKSTDNSKKLKFYISNSSFDSYLPKYLWCWNTNYFIVNKNTTNNLLNGYFFRKFFVTSYNKGKNVYFLGYLNSNVKNIKFPQKTGFKWVWY